MEQIIREVTEIELHQNDKNKENGLRLSLAWNLSSTSCMNVGGLNHRRSACPGLTAGQTHMTFTEHRPGPGQFLLSSLPASSKSLNLFIYSTSLLIPRLLYLSLPLSSVVFSIGPLPVLEGLKGYIIPFLACKALSVYPRH
jgi:hypothetical protein